MTQKDIYEKVINMDNERDKVNYIFSNYNSAFKFNSSGLERTLQQLYDFNLPNEEIRDKSSHWWYEIDMKYYDNIMEDFPGNSHLQYEKELYKTVYNHLKRQ